MNGLLERSMAKFIIYPVIRQLCRFHRVLRCPSRKPSPRGKSDQWIYSFSFYRIVHRKRMIGFSGSMCPVHFRFDSLSTRIDFFFEFPFLLCFSSSSLHLFFETYIQRIVQINFNCVFFSFFFMQCIFSFFQILQWLLFLHWYKKTILRNILRKENWSIIRIINKGMNVNIYDEIVICSYKIKNPWQCRSNLFSQPNFWFMIISTRLLVQWLQASRYLFDFSHFFMAVTFLSTMTLL